MPSSRVHAAQSEPEVDLMSLSTSWRMGVWAQARALVGPDAAELQEQMDAERVEGIRQQIIEEERKRMLAAHAANLGLKHLPKGVLSTNADLEMFKSGMTGA